MQLTKVFFLFFVLCGSVLFAGGSRSAMMSVTASVPAHVVIHSASPFSATVGVVLNPNTTATVWLDDETCASPQPGQILPKTGWYSQSFTEGERAGKNTLCVESSDGVLKASAPLVH